MAWPKWADREDYVGLPAAPVKCPCCKKKKAADMIYQVSHLNNGVQNAIKTALGIETLPDYLCDGTLAILHRKGSGANLPGSR